MVLIKSGWGKCQKKNVSTNLRQLLFFYNFTPTTLDYFHFFKVVLHQDFLLLLLLHLLYDVYVVLYKGQ